MNQHSPFPKAATKANDKDEESSEGSCNEKQASGPYTWLGVTIVWEKALYHIRYVIRALLNHYAAGG